MNELRANLTEKERQFNSGHLKTVQLKANIDSTYKMMADKVRWGPEKVKKTLLKIYEISWGSLKNES